MGTNGDLLDPSQYTVVPHVAILDETTLPIPSKTNEGEFEYFVVDEEFLNRVAANGNRREAETGDMAPLVIGRHTKKNAAETAQPEIVGWARNWVVDRLGNTNRLAAHADLWIKNEDVERVKKHPRRSAEVWRGRAEIDPIALLGATTPERDLGLLPIALNRGGTCSGPTCTVKRHPDQEISATFYRDRGFDMPTPTDTDKGQEQGKLDATPTLADLAQAISKLTAAVTDMKAQLDGAAGAQGGDGQVGPDGAAGGAPGQPGAGGEPSGEMSDDEINALIAELEGKGGAPGADGPPGGEGGQPPRKEDAPTQAMGYAGGSNTYTPKEQPKQLSRDEEMERLRNEVAAIQLDRAREVVTNKINDLVQNHNVIIDNVAEEIQTILALPPEMRPVMLSRIEKSYQRRTPGNGQVLGAVQNAANQTAGAITPAQQEEVVRLAREDGVTYEVAYKKLHGRFPFEPPVRV